MILLEHILDSFGRKNLPVSECIERTDVNFIHKKKVMNETYTNDGRRQNPSCSII